MVVSQFFKCETFGDYFAKDVGTTYFKLFKSCVNVHSDNPIYLVLLEWGLPPIKAVIYWQWLKFTSVLAIAYKKTRTYTRPLGPYFEISQDVQRNMRQLHQGIMIRAILI